MGFFRMFSISSCGIAHSASRHETDKLSPNGIWTRDFHADGAFRQHPAEHLVTRPRQLPTVTWSEHNPIADFNVLTVKLHVLVIDKGHRPFRDHETNFALIFVLFASLVSEFEFQRAVLRRLRPHIDRN